MSLSPISDTLAVTTLAYSLYKDVIKVAADAPQQFRDLSRDLQMIKGVLYHISRENDTNYGTAVRNVLKTCFETLREFRSLTVKYEKLASSDRNLWFKRLQWAADQGKIEDFQTRFRVHQQLLQLVLTSDGRQRLTEKAQNDATKTEEYEGCSYVLRQVATRTTTTDSRTLLNSADSISRSATKTEDAQCTCFRNRTGSTTAKLDGSDALQKLTLAPCSHSVATVVTSCSKCSESIDEVAPTEISAGISSGDPRTDSSIISSSSTTIEPLILPIHRQRHNASPEVRTKFLKSYEPVKELFTTETWLRLATWWLIKSRTVSSLLSENDISRQRAGVLQPQTNWETSISSEQAYTDLLKSSWILEDIVLSNDVDNNLAYNTLRRISKDLARSLDRDLDRYRSAHYRSAQYPDQPPWHDRNFDKQDLDLLESFEQMVEAPNNVPNAMDDPASAHRWLEVDQDNAGSEGERVQVRTFVNAQLGSRTDRSKSSTAPYMLLLWTKADECDLLISLCNHRGTVNLSREMNAEDLSRYEDTEDNMPLTIDFPSQDAEIVFLSPKDMSDFFILPKQFFAAMKDRDPRSGELAIYQASISAYSDYSQPLASGQQLSPSIAAGKFSSCGLKLYESLPDKCWKATRRLVISSPPDGKDPKCVSHWLPPSNVRISVEGAKATVIWSGCDHLEKTRGQNYDYHYSYIYESEQPNRRIALEFRDEQEARHFRDCLLTLTEMPPHVETKVEIPSAFHNTRIYRLFDVDEPDRQYHAISSIRSTPKGPHMTELYYTYRDLDWDFEVKNGGLNNIKFSGLRAAHYLSTVPRLKYEPRPTDCDPQFKEVTEVMKTAKLELDCDHDVKNVMFSLTGWTLKFFRILPKMALIDSSPLLYKSKTTYKEVYVQIWEKAAEEGRSRIQFAVRLESEARDRWITASFPGSKYSSEARTAEVSGLSVRRGDEVDIKHMSAGRRGIEERAKGKDNWRIILTFEEREHKKEFMKACDFQENEEWYW